MASRSVMLTVRQASAHRFVEEIHHINQIRA
jgi:hypothetical protein